MIKLAGISDARHQRIVAVLAVCLATSSIVSAEDVVRVAPLTPLDHGFSGLYNLDFAGAQKDFAAWQAQHPDDPVGPVSEAAGLLFSEFNRLGVLEVQFFENDDSFSARSKLTADPAVRDHFVAAIGRADNLARARLAKDPKDRDALFASTMCSGLQADYAALIEKRNLASLRFHQGGLGVGATVAVGLSRLLRRAASYGIQQVHHWKHGRACALDVAARWLARRQTAGNRRLADHSCTRTLSGPLRANPARDCLRAGEG